ncbi:hypothetical protein P171DRAFT_440387 [Karstenula rhodostoma CBS 690.94]|uniref:Uncharacterized protein n=1 Tax=Karstenula rhodostoma CBS 690.94 TaxID=1392251 RepID=A0A9P4UFF9_9PLEO|nr:hypothetical protein P171DRAFT_440387 [Karstenula rhodostoma CBS 690.94]
MADDSTKPKKNEVGILRVNVAAPVPAAAVALRVPVRSVTMLTFVVDLASMAVTDDVHRPILVGSRGISTLLHTCVATAINAVIAPESASDAALLEAASGSVRADQLEDLGVQTSAVPAAVRLDDLCRKDISPATSKDGL